MSKNCINILLVEDNEGDIVLAREVLDDIKIINKVAVARDGEEALNYLYNSCNNQTKDALPDLVFLDINMPKVNGFEVLIKMKRDNLLKVIPVIMLTTSSAERDIRFSYENYANCFITKPVGMEEFMEVIQKIENFWISIAKLPCN